MNGFPSFKFGHRGIIKTVWCVYSVVSALQYKWGWL